MSESDKPSQFNLLIFRIRVEAFVLLTPYMSVCVCFIDMAVMNKLSFEPRRRRKAKNNLDPTVKSATAEILIRRSKVKFWVPSEGEVVSNRTTKT